jgi:DNA repair protein RadC
LLITLPLPSDSQSEPRASRASALTDEELVAAILGMGTAGIDMRTVARPVAALIQEHRDALSLNHLLAVPGMGLAKAAQIL